MTYKGKYEVEAYMLTKENIEEIGAWCKWFSTGIYERQKDQYLYKGLQKCHIGEYMVQQRYTGNEEFYVLSEKQFIQIFSPIIT